MKYSMAIEWSDDNTYLVTLPVWEGRVFNPVTHGDSCEAAVRSGEIVLTMLVKSAQEQGQSLTPPNTYVASVA
jgi:predicted RNase H-like HicB family nuclease